MKTIITLVTVLTLHLLLPTVQAQWSHSPDSNLFVGYGMNPRILSDGDGGCFINWYSGGGHVRIQKIDKWGYAKWPYLGIYPGGNDTCAQDVGHMAQDGHAGAFVSFYNICCIANCGTTYPTETYHTYVQHIDSSGNLLWGIGIEPSVIPHYQCTTTGMVEDDSGGVYVVYGLQYVDNGPTEQYIQRLDGQGNRLWSDGGLNLHSGGVGPPLSDGSGGIIYNYSPNTIQRRNRNAETVWGDSGVYMMTGVSEIATDGTQFVYIRGGTYLGNYRSILQIQNVSLHDGSLQWQLPGITLDTINTLTDRVLEIVAQTEIGLWISSSKNSTDLFLQSVSDSGSLRFPIPGIHPSVFLSDKGGMVIESMRDSSVIAVWLDHRNGIWQHFAQRIGISGSYFWNEDVRLTPAGFFVWPYSLDAFATDDRNSAILASEQDFEIYASQISLDGQLGTVTGIVMNNSNKHPALSLYQNQPNPFNNTTLIRFKTITKERIVLTLYNVLGQNVKTFSLGTKEAGSHTHVLDMSGMSSGVYIYAIEVGGTRKSRKLLFLK